LHNDLAVWPGTKAQFRVRLDIVLERKLLVLVPHHRTCDERQHQVLGHTHIAHLGHAADLRGDSLEDLRFKVYGPTVLAEGVAAGQAVELVPQLGAGANWAHLAAVLWHR